MEEEDKSCSSDSQSCLAAHGVFRPYRWRGTGTADIHQFTTPPKAEHLNNLTIIAIKVIIMIIIINNLRNIVYLEICMIYNTSALYTKYS